MKLMKRNRKMWLIVASIFLLALLPATSFSQGRGRGQDKKLDKFVNGHDARNGRWDGRGPFSDRGLRRRGFDNNQFLRSQRSPRWNRRVNRRGF